ncbi:hypothetical protein [Mycobacterium uberis]|uniref:hypothetical protein n=1 Tax=Mycobacterium uberis TaxID=2162698 RepID=UPI001FB1DFE7|nr:hypothetical protein [Mycobacterium uberis]
MEYLYLALGILGKMLQAITEHGGAVLCAAEDIPYGRIAAVTDLDRCGFRLVFTAEMVTHTAHRPQNRSGTPLGS